MSHGGNFRQFSYYLGNHNHQRPCYLNTEVKINPMATEEKTPVRGNRITILLIILIVMICGLAYDRFIARPGCEKGFETVRNLVQNNVAASLAEEPTFVQRQRQDQNRLSAKKIPSPPGD